MCTIEHQPNERHTHSVVNQSNMEGSFSATKEKIVSQMGKRFVKYSAPFSYALKNLLFSTRTKLPAVLSPAVSPIRFEPELSNVVDGVTDSGEHRCTLSSGVPALGAKLNDMHGPATAPLETHGRAPFLCRRAWVREETGAYRPCGRDTKTE